MTQGKAKAVHPRILEAVDYCLGINARTFNRETVELLVQHIAYLEQQLTDRDELVFSLKEADAAIQRLNLTADMLARQKRELQEELLPYKIGNILKSALRGEDRTNAIRRLFES